MCVFIEKKTIKLNQRQILITITVTLRSFKCAYTNISDLCF